MQTLSLRLSILGTLSYSSLFQFPLTSLELLVRLMGHFPELNKTQLESQLKKMSEVKFFDGVWFLKNEEHLVSLRKKKQYFSHIKRKELESLKQILSHIPTLSAVYITGSLAVENIHSLSDDIDVLVVSKPGLLWMSRLIVIVWTSIIGKYRLHGSRGEFGWCFNLWLDRKNLEMPKEARSVYTSYEIIQAKQLLGTENELLEHNQWIKEYINYSFKTVENDNYEALTKHDRGGGQFFWLFEKLAFQIQRLYMSSRKTTERVGNGYAFFHPRDTKNIIVKKWEEKLEEVGVGKGDVALLNEFFERGMK